MRRETVFLLVFGHVGVWRVAKRPRDKGPDKMAHSGEAVVSLHRANAVAY
jgi:hypothetical protein